MPPQDSPTAHRRLFSAKSNLFPAPESTERFYDPAPGEVKFFPAKGSKISQGPSSPDPGNALCSIGTPQRTSGVTTRRRAFSHHRRALPIPRPHSFPSQNTSGLLPRIPARLSVSASRRCAPGRKFRVVLARAAPAPAAGRKTIPRHRSFHPARNVTFFAEGNFHSRPDVFSNPRQNARRQEKADRPQDAAQADGAERAKYSPGVTSASAPGAGRFWGKGL